MADSLYFYAGWLIDGSGSPAARRQLIETEDGMVTRVRSVRDSSEIRNLAYVDLSMCTLLPGLVDSHVHLTLSGSEDVELRSNQLGYTYEQTKPFMADRLYRYLQMGILAVRDGGDAGGFALRCAREVRPDGNAPVTIRAAGKAWHALGRYGGFIGRAPLTGVSLGRSVWDQENGEDHIKIINSGINSVTEFGRQTRPQFTSDEMTAVVKEGRRRGLPVMVHANGVDPVRLSVEAGCSSIEHGFFMGPDNLAGLAERQIFWVPTAFTMKALSYCLPAGSTEADIARRTSDHQVEQIAAAMKLGVRVALGTDAGTIGVRHASAVVEEMRILMEAGYSTEGAIRCASAEGAQLLGVQDELGQVKKGMPASFLAVKGSPEGLPASLGAVQAVYVRGVKAF